MTAAPLRSSTTLNSMRVGEPRPGSIQAGCSISLRSEGLMSNCQSSFECRASKRTAADARAIRAWSYPQIRSHRFTVLVVSYRVLNGTEEFVDIMDLEIIIARIKGVSGHSYAFVSHEMAAHITSVLVLYVSVEIDICLLRFDKYVTKEIMLGREGVNVEKISRIVNRPGYWRTF